MDTETCLSRDKIKKMVKDVGTARAQRVPPGEALRLYGEPDLMDLVTFRESYESAATPRRVIFQSLRARFPKSLASKRPQPPDDLVEQVVVEQVPGDTPAGRLLRKQEQAIYKKLLGDIPTTQLAEFVEVVTENPSWYGADDNPLPFHQQQGIMALASIRGLHALLPPPRAIPLPGDAELSQIAMQALIAGALIGSAFPEQLRDKESGLAELGYKFATGCKKERTNPLKTALSKILTEKLEADGESPEWTEVVDMLLWSGFRVDGKAERIYWESNGKQKSTSFKTIKNRLSVLRKKLDSPK